MIAVVADDLTGAAELGGIGLRYGLAVQMATAVPAAPAAGLLVIATDTRSQSQAQAQATMSRVMRDLARLQPALIFKKIDSVLRGHVLAELQAQLRVLGREKALVVPANPALGRTIAQGTYYYQGTPIHESSFAQDPEFPVSSSRVLEMVGARSQQVQVLPAGAPRPERGIVIGEAASVEDLRAWAGSLDPDTAVAGAAGFFTAVLEARGLRPQSPAAGQVLGPGRPVLYVSGSTFHRSRLRSRAEKESGGPVSYLPRHLLQSSPAADEQVRAWAAEIAALLHTRGRAVIAIDPAQTTGLAPTAADLRALTARVVQQVFDAVPIAELLVEGGATAAAILDRLHLTSFTPVQELAPGVIRMQVTGIPDLYLTLKPGSYDWPPGPGHFNPQPS